MQMQTSSYHSAGGWSRALQSELDGPDTLVLAFGARAYAEDNRPFADLRAAFPQAVLAGCSTSGEIAGSELHDASVSVAVVRFRHTTLRLAQSPVADQTDSQAAGQRLGRQLPHAGLRAVFLLSDGLCVNATALVDGLASTLPAGVSVTGGLAGDGNAFQRTWVLADDRPQGNHVCAVGLYGERLYVGSGCDGGWSDFGPQRRITRASGSVLHELDGKPALDLYKDYLGALASGLPGAALLFPLSIRPPGSQGVAVVRTILGVDEAGHSMRFAGDMPEGWKRG